MDIDPLVARPGLVVLGPFSVTRAGREADHGRGPRTLGVPAARNGRDVPPVEDAAWVRNPIDAFILAALEENGLKPAPEADRPTLAAPADAST